MLIPTKFCTVIKTTKYSSCVIRTLASQIQDGGRPPLWKNCKIAISQKLFDGLPQNLAWGCVAMLPSWKIEKLPYIGKYLTNFDEIWHCDAVRLSCTVWLLKIWNFRNPSWRRPPSWKIKMLPNCSNGLTDRHEIWHRESVTHVDDFVSFDC